MGLAFGAMGKVGIGGGIMSGAGEGIGFGVADGPVALKAILTIEGSVLNWARVSLIGALNSEEKCSIMAACA